ncbi:MAG: hypothetical protein LBQ14_12085 [Treponema sp.]|nr:hypothetical protein [Treponema sp.]
MDRGTGLGTLLVMSVLAFGVVFAGCGSPPGNTIERVPVGLSEIFSIGAKAVASHTSDAGWLIPAESGAWQLDSTDTAALADGEGKPYDGVRLWNIDGDLMIRNVPFDASAYDGVIFKYRTNCTEITPKFLDFSYRWAVYGINFKAFDYTQGFNSPNEYKEIVIPFYKAVRNVEALSDYPDNNPDNFDYNQLRQLTFDMRAAADGGTTYWCEIVDFDFFVYK